MRTERELAQEAWDVQDACNMGGVSAAFARAVRDLNQIARERGKGTDWVNAHPVTKAWASKIASLSEMHADPHEGLQAVLALKEGKPELAP